MREKDSYLLGQIWFVQFLFLCYFLKYMQLFQFYFHGYIINKHMQLEKHNHVINKAYAYDTGTYNQQL